MKKILLCACSIIMSFSVHAQDFESAQDAVKNMGVGWNMGNTLEACSGSAQGLESETYWGQPVTKPELMQMMKEAGFGAIRVPVTWYNHMDADGKVDAAWMKRVHEVVDYVINQDMYCIVNVHHDTGDGKQWLHASMNTYNNVKTKYEYLWKQIAEEFKDYGEKLLFESYNEMLDDHNSWCFATFNRSGGYDANEAKDAYDAINSYAQSFVTTVRNTSGNNATRNLIVNTYGACNGSGTWNAHLKDPLTSLVIPEAENNHVIVEVHAYPSIVNTNSSGDYLSDKTIATISSETKEMMDGLNTYFVAKGIPVIIGEWGTSNVDKAETDYMARKSLMFQFVDNFITQAKNYHIATFYWMGLSDGANREIPAFNQADLAERIVKAYHGNDFEGKFPNASDHQFEYTVTYTADWQELNLYSGSAIKLSEYKGIRLEMAEIPAEGALKIKVYGDKKDASNYKEASYSLEKSAKNTTVNFESAKTGSTVTRVTLQTYVGATEAKVSKAVLIKKDGTEVDSEISVFWGCTLSKKDVTPSGISSVVISPTINDGAIYTLSGQKITNPRKGIYIQNGKKLIVK